MNQTLSEINSQKEVKSIEFEKNYSTVKLTSKSFGWLAITVLVLLFTFSIAIDFSKLRMFKKIKYSIKKRRTNRIASENPEDNKFEVFAKVRKLDIDLQHKLELFKRKST
jgi:hypothetical protein